MNQTIPATLYLAGGGEIGNGAKIFTSLREAMKTELEYIDIFVDGIHSETIKYVSETGSYTHDF